MCDKYSYLNGGPEHFVKVCDVLLKLDDGSELPAHSQMLARSSSGCADMLNDGPLSHASPLKKATLPLTDCSRATVTDLLSVLHSRDATVHIKKDSTGCLAMASLAHKLDMKVCFPVIGTLFAHQETALKGQQQRTIFLQDIVGQCNTVIAGTNTEGVYWTAVSLRQVLPCYSMHALFHKLQLSYSLSQWCMYCWQQRPSR